MAETAKKQCLNRWPSLRLACRAQRGRFRISAGPLFVASGKTAKGAWTKALKVLDSETTAMYRSAFDKTLGRFGHGIQSPAEGPRP